MASEIDDYREEHFANSRWGTPPPDPFAPADDDESYEELTPEERHKQRGRETALRLIAEGRFSTPEQRSAGGRAAAAAKRERKRPMMEVLADRSRNNAPEIFDRVMEIVRSKKSDRDSLAAVQILMNATEWREKVLREDERDFARLSGKELQAAWISVIAEASGRDIADIEAMAGLSNKQLDVGSEDDVIDAEVVDDDTN